MDNKIKNYLGIAIIVSMIIVALTTVSYVNSFSKSVRFSSQRDFSVSASGKSVGIPDVAEFTFSVITQGGKDVGALQKENSDKMNKAIDFLKAQKIDVKDIKTQNYSVEPRYEYQYCSSAYGKTCPPPEIVGYTITQTVNVKIRDFSKISNILSGVVAQGANSVSQLSFKVDDSTSLENQARTEAIQKAKQKAEAVAKAGGFRLGRLISIEEGSNYLPAYKYDTGLGMGGGVAESSAPTVEPGSQEVNVSVTLRYEIK